MHVFFDLEVFQFQQYGGVSRYCCELAYALACTQQCDVTLFGGWTRNAYIQNMPQHPRLSCIYFKRRDTLRINSLVRQLSRLWQRLVFNRIRKRVDQLIYHSTFFDLDVALNEKANATIITMHDMIVELFSNNEGHARSQSSLKKHALNYVDHVIAVSQNTLNDFLKVYPFDQHRTSVIYLGPSTTQSMACSSLPDMLKGSSYFLMVGNRSDYKNGLVALKAFALLAGECADLKLVLCGGGPLSLEEYTVLEEAIKERVHCISINDSMLASLYKDAVALVYPSLYEGFGLPVLEAMACACPVIAYKSSSIPEVAGDAACYVDVHSMEAVAAAMRLMLNDRQQRLKFKQAGIVQSQLFSWEKTALETIEVYQKSLT